MANRLIAWFFVALMALPAIAEQGYVIVHGVDADDKLNVRLTPGGEIIDSFVDGSLFHSSGERERLSRSTWQKVSIGEIEGWVSTAYIRPAEVIPIDATRIPIAGQCAGFEPGWVVAWRDGHVTFDSPLGSMNYDIDAARNLFGFIKAERLRARAGSSELELTIKDSECNALPVDGFVWGSASLVVTRDGVSHQFEGCCMPISGGWR